ncbi:PEP-CTERM sorting domain-containing protein [Roseateles cellulosilyticus]|uniref:PEP-CTERM sorting domain-containing protein n=1 Tax=Pelomonas cellulosilytica TaxID=2906762 RepID=A0ABS8XYZ7_9BURK|nr:PEP-CTERM sorting domain-containing protein [Pelomonas sp. P8]MCE4557844.1 PEP-CTERM sorting domain-containing protein [Pelomonas sp. P8]
MLETAAYVARNVAIVGDVLSKVALSWALAAVAFEVHSATVLNTFAGPGMTATGASWRLGSDGDQHAGSTGQALAFELASAATIDSVVTTIEGAGTVSLSIVGDMPGFDPDFGFPMGPTYFTRNLTDPTSKTSLDGLNVHLPAGHYWLVALEAPGLGFIGGWQGGGASVSSPWRFYMSRADWMAVALADPPAALITSTVPEPGTGSMIVGGLAAVGFAVLARRRAPCRLGLETDLSAN